MRTIAIVNQKGGCGKTTTAINLASELARAGARTLLVDLDPQGHCAAGLGVPEESIKRGIEEALIADLRYDAGLEELRWEVGAGLHLVPSTMRLAGLEALGGGLSDRHDKDRRLERVLSQVEGQYDFALVDCSPSIGLLTFNALRAADELLIPVETGYFALRGALRQVKTVEAMAERIGRPLDFFLLPTLHREDSPRAMTIISSLHEQFGARVTPVIIREHELLRQAASMGQPIQELAPSSAAADDFRALAEWVRGHSLTDVATERVRRRKETEGGQKVQPIPAPVAALPSADMVEPTQEPEPVRSERVADVLQRVRAGGARGGGAKKEKPFVSMEALPSEAAKAVRSRRGAATAPLEVDEGKRVFSERASGSGTTTSKTAPAVQTSPVGLHAAPTQSVTAMKSVVELKTDAMPDRYGTIQAEGGVRFIQPAGSAQTIAVTGGFCGWNPEGLPLIRDQSGRYFEAFFPLAAGRYEYHVLIDGVPGPDAFVAARAVSLDGPDRSIVTV